MFERTTEILDWSPLILLYRGQLSNSNVSLAQQITAAAAGMGASDEIIAEKDGERSRETNRADGGRNRAAIRQATPTLIVNAMK